MDTIKWIIAWADRMNTKYGPPPLGDFDWVRKLAYYCDEAGADSPSIFAIEIAKKWEEQAGKLLEGGER